MAELTTKVQPEELRKGGSAMIRSMPCKLIEVTQLPKATANGNKRVQLIGLHVCTLLLGSHSLSLGHLLCTMNSLRNHRLLCLSWPQPRHHGPAAFRSATKLRDVILSHTDLHWQKV